MSGRRDTPGPSRQEKRKGTEEDLSDSFGKFSPFKKHRPDDPDQSERQLPGPKPRFSMAPRDPFNSDFLLAAEHDWVEIVKSRDYYHIDDSDRHLSTVLHGKLYDDIERADETDFRTVSFFVFKDFSEVTAMRNHLDMLSELSPYTIVKAFCGLQLYALADHRGNLTIGSMEVEISPNNRIPITVPCLVSERVSDLTFDEWVGTASEEDTLIFFREVFSTLGKLHKGKRYFGNSKKGIRISANRPMFVFPSRFEETKLDEGIKHDILELCDMVQKSKIPGDRERALFFKLCARYTSSDYKGEALSLEKKIRNNGVYTKFGASKSVPKILTELWSERKPGLGHAQIWSTPAVLFSNY
ncbi:hypothetical protein OROHE_019525 [Orobanche hederae]